MINTISNPEGPLAFWFSMIPLTSPIVMMVRIPFGVKAWELSLSAVILIIHFYTYQPGWLEKYTEQEYLCMAKKLITKNYGNG
jgi:hypothetical protein